MNPILESRALEAARRHDEAAFRHVVEPHRAGLLAHCYRVLGSTADAEDALQEALLRAWRGLPAFEGRSSLRSWLYTIATNVCLKLLERRPRRVLPLDFADPHGPPEDVAWLEPFPDAAVTDGPASPEARYEQRESVELAFAAALQHLPERQRAVLLLRDVLGFTPAEIATALDATPASVYSMLQRARETAATRLPERSQQATLRVLGDSRLRDLVGRYVRAWENADVAALAALLTEDATLAMPPRPDWYRGRDAVADFLERRPLRYRWERVPVGASGQPAFAVYEAGGDRRAHAIEVLTVTAAAEVAAITVFHTPEVFARFGLSPEREVIT